VVVTICLVESGSVYDHSEIPAAKSNSAVLQNKFKLTLLISAFILLGICTFED